MRQQLLHKQRATDSARIEESVARCSGDKLMCSGTEAHSGGVTNMQHVRKLCTTMIAPVELAHQG